MADQTTFEFETSSETTAPEQPATYPYPVAFHLLSMMAGEASYYLEQIKDLAENSGNQEIATAATRALRSLTDEPSRTFVRAAAQHLRARIVSEDCSYG